MTKKHAGKPSIDTRAVHAGRHPDSETGALALPLHTSTTFERDTDGGYQRGYSYGREDNPTRHALETCLVELESGATASAFPSGIAAANAIFHALQPGDHVLLSLDIYHGIKTLVREIIQPLGISASFTDFTDIAGIKAALQNETRLLWLETPTNPLLKIVDIQAIAALAREAGIRSVVDNTFATPVLQQPLALGCDLVMHSTTKYFGGHHDLTGGAIIAAEDDDFMHRVRGFQTRGGVIPSPFDCWLLLRSISTLPLRIRAQSAAAAQLAKFLAEHPAVQTTHYPGLQQHPQHELACKQMLAFGAVISFEVNGDLEQTLQVAAETKLFTRATSLGGVESLVEHRASVEGETSLAPPNLLRLSIGLESPNELIADLDQALTKIIN